MKIADLVYEYASANLGKEITARELTDFVVSRRPHTSPSSPDRILRSLRHTGAVRYTLLSQHTSRYQITGVS